MIPKWEKVGQKFSLFWLANWANYLQSFSVIYPLSCRWAAAAAVAFIIIHQKNRFANKFFAVLLYKSFLNCTNNGGVSFTGSTEYKKKYYKKYQIT